MTFPTAELIGGKNFLIFEEFHRDEIPNPKCKIFPTLYLDTNVIKDPPDEYFLF